MLRTIKNTNIVNEDADALIYSTNVMLNCSGGVGSELVQRYGNVVQEDLHRILRELEAHNVERGDIFEYVSEGMPYQLLFHTIPSNGWYETTPEIIQSILAECLHQCVNHGGIRKVLISVLATGYGDLSKEAFFSLTAPILNQQEFSNIDEIIIAIYDSYAFEQAAQQIKDEHLALRII